MSLPADAAPVDETPGATTLDSARKLAPEQSHWQPIHFLTNLLVPLHYRDFRLLFSGQLISIIGDNFYEVALPWLVLSKGGNAQDLGIVLVAYGIPRVSTVLVGGWLSDRLRPRRIMLSADCARMLLVGALAALAVWGHPAIWQICALVAPLGLFAGLFIPASWAMTPDVLPDDALQAGNSLNFSWVQLANLAGPVIGGLVVGWFRSGIALAVDAFTFIASAATLAAMRGGRKPEPMVTGVEESQQERQTEYATGNEMSAVQRASEIGIWQFLRGSRLFQLILLMVIAFNLIYGGTLEVGLPALAHGPLHAGATGYGTLLAAFGAGALVGGMSGGFLAHVPRPWLVNMVVWALQGLAVVAIPLTGTITGSAIALGLMGLCNGLGNVSFLTLVQQALPRHLMGRFMGAIAFGNFGLFPISVAVAGFAVAAFGPALVISAGGAFIILVIGAVLIPSEFRRIA
jgi:MFS family permease